MLDMLAPHKKSPDIDVSVQLQEDPSAGPSAVHVSLQLREDVKQCFADLSTKLCAEIRDLLSTGNHASISTFQNPTDLAEELDEKEIGQLISNPGNTVIFDMVPEESDTAQEENDVDQPQPTISNLAVESHRLKKSGTIRSSVSSHDLSTHLQSKIYSETHESDHMRRHVTSKVYEFINMHNEREKSRAHALYRFVNSTGFFVACMLLILFNAIWMGYQTDTRLQRERESRQGWDWYVNVIFTGWFILELIVKAIAQGKDFYRGSDASWNAFDLTLVVLSIPDLFTKFVAMTQFRVLRLVQLAEVFRLFKILRLFKRLRELLLIAYFTQAALFWSFIAIWLVTFVFALMIGNSIKESQARGAQFSPMTEKGFDTLSHAMLTLFTFISGGQEWYPFMKDFMSNDLYVAPHALLCWIFFMLFGFVNIVVAVFCTKCSDASQESYTLRIERLRDAQSKKIKDLTRIFRMIDSDSIGTINWEQFRDFAKGSDEFAMLQFHGLQLYAIHSFWRSIDPSKSDSCDVTAFVWGFLRLSPECTTTDIMMLQLKIQRMQKEFGDKLRQGQVEGAPGKTLPRNHMHTQAIAKLKVKL